VNSGREWAAGTELIARVNYGTELTTGTEPIAEVNSRRE
jgi:hypothetical protein